MEKKTGFGYGTYYEMRKRADSFLKALRNPMKRVSVVPDHQNPIRVVDGGDQKPGVTTFHVDDEGDSVDHDSEAKPYGR